MVGERLRPHTPAKGDEQSSDSGRIGRLESIIKKLQQRMRAMQAEIDALKAREPSP